MKITGVRTQQYEVELKRPLGDANSPQGRRHMASVAVFLDTDEGLTGIALAGPASRPHVHSMVESLLVGRDPRGVRGLWKRMIDAVFKGGNRGIAGDALSALDIALWDLKAKANGEPLWKTLGASTRCVKAYASGIDLPLSDEELRAFYESLAAKGVSAGKLKVGLDMEADLRRIGIMRDALATSGKSPVLTIDSNEYWSPKQAIRYIRRIEEEYDLTWAEEPARRWDYRGLRQVSQSVRAAVATGENLDDISDFMPLIANEAVDVVEVGQGTSGITGAMMVADLAYAYELPVAMMNCPGNLMAHLAAALPNHLMMEVLDAGRDVVMSVDNHIEDGWIVLGDEPGLGLVFDEGALAAHAVDKPSRDAQASPWGRRKGAGLYQVAPGEPEDVGEE
ncbi:MAG: mandelate racemase/muconate lactonizing enzyme family protein [Chloroflexi bacterium]|nr:mandelate racemase/muconate lactonizing enzyme family protein [Chloroflexota bacterium]